MRAMMLSITCILATLLAEGHALKCMTCVGLSPTACLGGVVACATSDNACTSTIASISTGVMPVTQFYRMCGKTSSCLQDQTLTASTFTMRRSTTCCTSENCTPAAPSLPPVPDTKENGVSCRSCYGEDEYCDKWDTMKCTGSETKCIRYSSKTESGTTSNAFSLRGCASEKLCNSGNGSSSVTFGSVTQRIDMACTDGGIRPEHGLLLPLLAGLVLVKLFS